MNALAIWKDVSNFGIVDALIVALVAILLVFLVLIIIIFVTSVFQKSLDGFEARTKILPKEQNKILADDHDAVVASLVAVIDFHKETGKNAEIISIQKVED